MNKGKFFGGPDAWDYLPDAWPLLSAREHAVAFCERNNFSKKGLRERGFFKSLATMPNGFVTEELTDQLHRKVYWPPDHMTKRKVREEMQKDAMQGHASEEPWTNTDQHGYEWCSSRCSVVGMLVGYTGSAKEPGQAAQLAKSRKKHGTLDFNVDLLTHKCRF